MSTKKSKKAKKVFGQRFSPEEKAKAIRASKTMTFLAAGNLVGASHESVANWVANEAGYPTATAMRRAGAEIATPTQKPGQKRRAKPVSGVKAMRKSRAKTSANGVGLPTSESNVRPIRSSRNALVASSFSCPHCLGAIDLAAPMKSVSI